MFKNLKHIINALTIKLQHKVISIQLDRFKKKFQKE